MELDQLINDFVHKLGDNPNTNGPCPVYLDRNADIVMNGPRDMTEDDVQRTIEDLNTWGVCRRFMFPSTVDGGETECLYSGMAGMIDRFNLEEYPVPFTVSLKVNRLMYELGTNEYKLQGDDYTQYQAERLALLEKQEGLEDLVMEQGGNLASGERPKTDALVDTQNQLISLVKESVPSGDTIVSPTYDLTQSTWSPDRWLDSWMHQADVAKGHKNQTLQDYVPPLSESVFLHHDLPRRYELRLTVSVLDGKNCENGSC